MRSRKRLYRRPLLDHHQARGGQLLHGEAAEVMADTSASQDSGA